MQFTQKEILDALKVIQKTCEEYNIYKDNCTECPFYSVSNCGCVFMDSKENPDEWELNSPDRTWHAVF